MRVSPSSSASCFVKKAKSVSIEQKTHTKKKNTGKKVCRLLGQKYAESARQKDEQKKKQKKKQIIINNNTR